MESWIVLLRGINVGGKNSLPMAELRHLMNELGLTQVQTYIQSGNIVCMSKRRTAKDIQEEVADGIERLKGFRPEVMAISVEEFQQSVRDCPYLDLVTEPKTLHFFFMNELPRDANLSEMEKLKSDHEQFSIHKRVFYLLAPDGIGRSKLAAAVERLLRRPATARNYRTVTKLLEMARALLS